MRGRRRSLTPAVLVVSEDPSFIESVRDLCRCSGGQVAACLGPSQSPCLMDVKGTCVLAEHADVILVDSPRTGVFGGRWGTLPAGAHAEKLAARHPDAFVVLAACSGTAGPTGEVTSVPDRDVAVELLERALG